MTLVSYGDFIDLYYDIKRRGASHILSKLNPVNGQRVINTWDCIDDTSSDWWIIPAVRKRWNQLITGSEEVEYQEYVCKKYFAKKTGLRMLSVGCGGGTAEIKFSKQGCFDWVEGFDVSEKIVAHASRKIAKFNLPYVGFFKANVYSHNFGKEKYDSVLFHSSLHHFADLEKIIEKVKIALKTGGLVIIHEYVGPNRNNWTNKQLAVINELLAELPDFYKRRFDGKSLKTKVFRPGLLRMFLNDPSEAVESENVLPVLSKHFLVMEEKGYGGNILHMLLKDIAHNFTNKTADSEMVLKKLFDREDDFLKKEKSDFAFAVYKKTEV